MILKKFLEKVKELLEKQTSVVIAVSEGIKLADGRYVCELGSSGDYVDAFGHKQLQGNSHVSGKLSCSRVWMQDKSSRTFYLAKKCVSYGLQSGY